MDRPAVVIWPRFSGLGDAAQWLGCRKPLPDDHTTLSDVWIFTDFWQKAGITYPDTDLPQRSVRFNEPGHEALPTGGPAL